MKTHIFHSMALLFFISLGHAEESVKPLVSLSVKPHVMDTDKNDLGPRSEARSKDYTLRVTIKNVSPAPLEGAELFGVVLVERSAEDKERLTIETLTSLSIPRMSSNETLTLDLGKITLRQVEWRNHKFQEKLEEWKVVCKKEGVTIGEAVSDKNFEAKIKQLEAERDELPDRPIRDPRKRPLRD